MSQAALCIARPTNASDQYITSIDVNAYLKYTDRLSPRHLCSLAAALIAQRRLDEGASLLRRLIDSYPENNNNSDVWYGDALLNYAIALSSQRNIVSYFVS